MKGVAEETEADKSYNTGPSQLVFNRQENLFGDTRSRTTKR